MEHLKKLLQEVNVILQKEKVRKEESRKRGERFNVFEMLGVAHYEVTHSKIIASFLNPQGSHGQGDLFLRLFLQTIENKDKINIDTSNAKVYTEYDIGVNGRLDIFIDNGSYGIIIENKVYAGDQSEQLSRYDTFAKKKYKEGNYTIYYLTLDGHEASEDSIKNKETEECVNYYCISYSKDIINWLQLCIQESATMPLVRETLVQYLNHIRQLTNQDMDSLNKEKIMELFDSPEKWSAFIELSNMREKLVYELKSRLVFELQRISEKYIANSNWEFFYDNDINIISIRPIDTPLIGIAVEWSTWNFPWSKRSAAIRIEANKINSVIVFEKIKKTRHLLPMQDFEENVQNNGWFPFIKQIPAKVFNVKDEISSFEECLYIANKNPEILANNLWKEVFEPFAKKEYANIMSSCVTQ